MKKYKFTKFIEYGYLDQHTVSFKIPGISYVEEIAWTASLDPSLPNFKTLENNPTKGFKIRQEASGTILLEDPRGIALSIDPGYASQLLLSYGSKLGEIEFQYLFKEDHPIIVPAEFINNYSVKSYKRIPGYWYRSLINRDSLYCINIEVISLGPNKRQICYLFWDKMSDDFLICPEEVVNIYVDTLGSEYIPDSSEEKLSRSECSCLQEELRLIAPVCMNNVIGDLKSLKSAYQNDEGSNVYLDYIPEILLMTKEINRDFRNLELPTTFAVRESVQHFSIVQYDPVSKRAWKRYMVNCKKGKIIYTTLNPSQVSIEDVLKVGVPLSVGDNQIATIGTTTLNSYFVTPWLSNYDLTSALVLKPEAMNKKELEQTLRSADIHYNYARL